MTTEEYSNNIKSYHDEFGIIWDKIVRDTNGYLKEHPTRSGLPRNADVLVDDLCLAGAWIHDRITGKSGVPGSRLYRGSLSKKIRKALGYTY